MTYLNVKHVNTGIKVLVDDIRNRKGFVGDTKHWIAASLEHGLINVLPFNFIGDRLPSRLLDDCFPDGCSTSAVFKDKNHVILQSASNKDIFDHLVAIVHSGAKKTHIFDRFVICSLSQDEKFQALTIDEVADVLEQLQLNSFLNLIEVSRYY